MNSSKVESDDKMASNPNQKKNKNLSRILWTAFLVGSFGIFVFHSSSLIIKFCQYDTSVTVVLDGIDFILPDIYICNNIPFSKHLILQHEEMNTSDYTKLINKLIEGKSKLNFPFYINQELEGYSKKFIFNLLSNRSYKDFNPKFTIRNEDIDITTMFDQVPHSYHSFCYKLKKSYEEYLFEAGVLEFVLYTDKLSYLNKSKMEPYVSRMTDGLSLSDCSHTVYVVPAGEYPHLASSKKEAEAGRKTTISITMNYYDRVQREELTCLVETRFANYPNYLHNSSGPLTYKSSPLDCAHQLMHQDWMNECNCTWEAHPVRYEDWLSGRVRICQRDSDVTECTGNHWNKRNVGQYYAQCSKLVACQLLVYTLHSESAPVSLRTQENYVNQFFLYGDSNSLIEEGYEEWIDSDKPPSRLLKSFSVISLYAPNRRSTIWQERFSYELKDLFSDIGGILGFYIGMSVVTLLEILRHASKTVAVWIGKKKKRKVSRHDGEEGHQCGKSLTDENGEEGEEDKC